MKKKSRNAGLEILSKAEFLNPGGSVKIIQEVKLLILESKCHVVIPDGDATEKAQILEALGAATVERVRRNLANFWEQTSGELDAFVAAAGTGGTVSSGIES
ncbi:hypothetical protein C5167_042580 [Papaver somniferum]|uniref:Tryptophan synthase beta chain-like PALP domain-containing protein n=1 Tax=Papaver somniferum TaxID=3469 RepID=A0A4Y7L381_PAPSO|nr:hypothetical protein C5167_042580 [Papaver somniferum]